MTGTEIDTVLQAFAAAGADRGLYYLSTPITTGRREFELMDKLGVESQSELRTRFPHEWREHVLDTNERNAISQGDLFTETVALGILVINPIRIHNKHWEQSDYDELWKRLISEYPTVLVPLAGWAFSRGARLEVALALRLGIPIVHTDGSPRSRSNILKEAASTDREIRLNGWNRYVGSFPSVEDSNGNGQTAISRATPLALPEEAFARQVFVWLAKERSYQVAKFGVEIDDRHTRTDKLDPEGWWTKQLSMYYHRARVLGLDSPNGRQALAKYVATGCGLLESVVRTCGWLPSPGVTSGEIERDYGSAIES